jgi:hypothetical protein
MRITKDLGSAARRRLATRTVHFRANHHDVERDVRSSGSGCLAGSFIALTNFVETSGADASLFLSEEIFYSMGFCGADDDRFIIMGSP